MFVSLWERRDELDIRGTLKHYLFQAVRYRAINVVQRERSQERIRQSFTWELPSRIRESQNTGPDIVEFEEAMHEVSTALAALPARTREIFMLRQGQGMSAEEIAEILKIGVPSVYNQISRATKAIKTALERWQRGA